MSEDGNAREDNSALKCERMVLLLLGDIYEGEVVWKHAQSLGYNVPVFERGFSKALKDGRIASTRHCSRGVTVGGRSFSSAVEKVMVDGKKWKAR